jgi:hypothetical protein
MAEQSLTLLDAWSIKALDCLKQAGLLSTPGGSNAAIQMSLYSSGGGMHSPSLHVVNGFWATPIHEGMENAPKDRPFLSFSDHCTGIDKWSLTIWRNRSYGNAVSYFERLPSHMNGFTHWCELPGDLTE